MPTAKDLRVAPIASADARAFIRRIHYSGTVARNSQLHFGVYLGDKLEGVMQFGPCLDKRKLQGLVSGTLWNGFVELNRLAFTERLPRNSESRALSIAFALIRKHYPHIEWVVSFADATQCGDGTIYRASGFLLTGITKNSTLWELGGEQFTDVSYRTGSKVREIINKVSITKGKHILSNGGSSMRHLIAAGARPLPGFQMRYVYFLNPAARARLTVPPIPFQTIRDMGAAMYRGTKASEVSDDRTNGTAAA